MKAFLHTTTRRLVAVSMASMLGATLAACTSSPSSTTASTTTTTAPKSASGAGSTSSKLSSLSSSIQGAENTSFKAIYSATDNGQSETVTYEQAPPKVLFAVSSGEVINNGTATYFCTTTGTKTCLSTTTEDPLASLLQAFSAKTAVSNLQQAESQLAAKVAGYSASFSSETFAGQASTCATVTEPAGTEKVCVTGNGELAYVSSSPSQVFQMTSYSTSVSPSDFSLPAGATIVTEP